LTISKLLAGSLRLGFLLLPRSDRDGKVGTPKLTHSALSALLGIGQHGESVLIRGQGAGGAKGHANAAPLAPGLENVDLLFRRLFADRSFAIGGWFRQLEPLLIKLALDFASIYIMLNTNKVKVFGTTL
jgi:hypothetical protein